MSMYLQKRLKKATDKLHNFKAQREQQRSIAKDLDRKPLSLTAGPDEILAASGEP